LASPLHHPPFHSFPTRRSSDLGGIIVILNHFRSQRRVTGWVEDMLAPLCTRLGWKSNLSLEPLLERVALVPEAIDYVNLFKGWRDRKSTRLNSSHGSISYAVFC